MRKTRESDGERKKEKEFRKQNNTFNKHHRESTTDRKGETVGRRNFYRGPCIYKPKGEGKLKYETTLLRHRGGADYPPIRIGHVMGLRIRRLASFDFSLKIGN
uniref:Uncharacterized protein n=1 Tax=Cucumis melo TaxID=3656 RepID=A0A9I9D288_CUCME